MAVYNNVYRERWSSLVDKKIRAITVVQQFWNTSYQGNPKAGSVVIPVIDTEVSVRAYDRDTGLAPETRGSSVVTLLINNDIAINEKMDGYDVAAVPIPVIAEKLSSGAYSMGMYIEEVAINTWRKDGKIYKPLGTAADFTPVTIDSNTAWITILKMKTRMIENRIPADNLKLFVSPEVHSALLADNKFLGASSDKAVGFRKTGFIGEVAGLKVYTSNLLGSTGDGETPKKNREVEIILANGTWSHWVDEWKVQPKIVSLDGTANYIGASALKGRKVFGCRTTKNGYNPTTGEQTDGGTNSNITIMLKLGNEVAASTEKYENVTVTGATKGIKQENTGGVDYNPNAGFTPKIAIKRAVKVNSTTSQVNTQTKPK